ncbi:MAG: hypothetical protein ABI683_06270 [Ginsengibacter sp.]
MKLFPLLFLLFLCSGRNSYAQNATGCNNKYFNVVSATMEHQVSGANTENARQVIYNIDVEAKRNFVIENVTGEINSKPLRGKIIYQNTIADIQHVKNASSFVIRFEKILRENETEGAQAAAEPPTTNQTDAKNNPSNSVIYLSFSIEKKRYCFSVLCVEKTKPPGRLLPQ